MTNLEKIMSIYDHIKTLCYECPDECEECQVASIRGFVVLVEQQERASLAYKEKGWDING